MEHRDYNSWLQDEHVKVTRDIQRLAEHVALVPSKVSDGWIGELRQRFEPLRAHLLRHMALEEKGGYLAGVLETRPTLSKEVERLRQEHHDMLRIMEQIASSLREVTADNRLLARDCCGRIKDLLGYLEEHQRQEDTIVVSAFSEDIGAED